MTFEGRKKARERKEYADRMKCAPHSDTYAVKYALSLAAKHFGLYRPTTAVCDITRSLFGTHISHSDAMRGYFIWQTSKNG